MAKKSVGVGYFGGNPKTRMSNVLAGDARTGCRAKFNQTSAMYSASPYADRPAPLSTYTPPKEKVVKDQSRVAPTAVQRATVPGGRGIMALDGVRLKPTANAPKATVTGAKPAPTAAASKRSVGETIRTFVNEKLTPNRKSTPMRGTNLGVSSGKTTGKTVSRGGTGGRTTGGGRATGGGNAFNKGGVAGPSRGGGGSRSSGGGKSSGGGNTGRGDVGAGRRGGRG